MIKETKFTLLLRIFKNFDKWTKIILFVVSL